MRSTGGRIEDMTDSTESAVGSTTRDGLLQGKPQKWHWTD